MCGKDRTFWSSVDKIHTRHAYSGRDFEVQGKGQDAVLQEASWSDEHAFGGNPCMGSPELLTDLANRHGVAFY